MTLKFFSIASIILASGIAIETNAIETKAEAASLSPNQIINTWTQGAEVNYGLSQGGQLLPSSTQPIWAADNTLLKVPFKAITNYPQRIGQDSSRDTERYGSLISNIVTTNDFRFSGSLMAPNDNDVIGLLWGYQDSNNHYRLSWGSNRVKRGTLPDGPYERPNLPAGPDNRNQIGAGGLIVTKEVNGQKDFLFSNFNLRWQPSKIYDFKIEQTGSDLTININQGAQTIFSDIFSDITFLSGKVGLNTAGVEVLYGNIRLKNLTSVTSSAVPEPLTLLGAAMAVSFGLFFKQKK